MTSQLDIANRALLSVGARKQVSSISPSDGSEEADAISVLYQPTYEALARTAHWNCLSKQVALTLLGAAQGTPENPTGTVFPIPPTPWLFMYQYPSDCLDFGYIVPSFPASLTGSPPQTTTNNASGTWLPTGGQIPFKVGTVFDSNNRPTIVVLTNQDLAQAVYTVNQPNPATWDSLFQAAMVASLAAFLVPALSLALPLMDRVIKLAEAAISQARTRDGNEGVTTQDHTPDWFMARAGGQGYGIGWGMNGFGSPLTNMAWPSNGD